jgi:flagellar hook-associated protein 1 FlgK
MVSLVGNKTAEIQVTAQAEQSLLTHARNSQQALSGVNLDEEAANLLRYQQAYQAAGRMLQVASTLFDTLLAIGN